ncbi:thioesterase family protein [Brevibacterium album]|uniref:thioesterase family protein n=1 Tax=Brevibacterium album TaxID=417948 RepID=UPI000413A214|nr:thioesterase family protein [Brevibacterium album]
MGISPTIPEPFYRQEDEHRFASLPATTGVWSPEHQHAGPPAALLVRAMEQHGGGEGVRLTDVRSDILGPIPVRPLDIEVRTLRGGRSMELLEASANADGRTVMTARAWRIRRAPEDYPELVGWRTGTAPAVPEAVAGARTAVFTGGHDSGYQRSVEWRFVTGGPGSRAPAVAWGRQHNQLVEGEEPSPWQRALVLADSAGGISLAVDPATHRFINCDLHVALDRDPHGEWLRMSAQSLATPGHGGIVHNALADVHGELGYGLQAMVAQNLG